MCKDKSQGLFIRLSVIRYVSSVCQIPSYNVGQFLVYEYSKDHDNGVQLMSYWHVCSEASATASSSNKHTCTIMRYLAIDTL